MKRQIDYREKVAAECARRADETDEKEEREFLYRMRDNWLRVASGLQSVGDGKLPGYPKVTIRLPTTIQSGPRGLRVHTGFHDSGSRGWELAFWRRWHKRSPIDDEIPF